MRRPRVVFGYSADEMIGSSILKLIPEDLHSDEKTIMENIRAGRRVEHFETVRRTKSGQLLDVSLTVSPIKRQARPGDRRVQDFARYLHAQTD